METEIRCILGFMCKTWRDPCTQTDGIRTAWDACYSHLVSPIDKGSFAVEEHPGINAICLAPSRIFGRYQAKSLSSRSHSQYYIIKFSWHAPLRSLTSLCHWHCTQSRAGKGFRGSTAGLIREGRYHLVQRYKDRTILT